MGLIISVLLIAALSPIISPYKPHSQHWGKEYARPGGSFLLGTDALGRDVLSQLIWGARTSILVALAGVIVAGVIGTLCGAVTGYFGGKIDQAGIMLTDTILTLPAFFSLLSWLLCFLSEAYPSWLWPLGLLIGP